MTWLAETAMLSEGWRRFLLLVLFGAIAGSSTAPLFVLPALFLAVPVWIWCLDGAERKGGIGRLFGPAFTIGFAFGLGYFTVAFHWLGAAFLLEGGIMLALMPPAILALAALIALFWGLGSALAHLFWSGGPWRILTFATFITAAEWARGHAFSGFPFDLVGYALTFSDEMMQLASQIGVYGLTFLALLLAALPALVWPGEGRRWPVRLLPIILALGFIGGQFAYGSYRLANTQVGPREDGLAMRLVQPLIYEHTEFGAVIPSEIVDRLIGLTETRTSPADPGLEALDYIVWPESSFPFFLSQYPEALARISRMLPDSVMLLTGAPREDLSVPGPAYNALLAIDTNGEVVASYDKSHLVPFGEYLPFPDFFAALGLRQFVPGANGWGPGDGRRLMAPLASAPFLALICYEAIFPGDLGEVAGAGFLLNITNDAWFDGSIGPQKHAHHARLRAVEEGLPLVRAANSGVTLLTDPLGRVTARLPEMQAGVLDVAPNNRLIGTNYAQLRDWPLLGVGCFGLLVALLSAQRRRRRRI